jgi:flagellar capping protein FliD
LTAQEQNDAIHDKLRKALELSADAIIRLKREKRELRQKVKQLEQQLKQAKNAFQQQFDEISAK